MAKKLKITYNGDRVCPVCHEGPLVFLREDLSYCPAEDPHPGGVLVYGGRTVRADRHIPKANA